MGKLTLAGHAISQYRESHHAVARLIAIGATPHHIRQVTGHSLKRIGMFANDPAFTELVAHYAAQVEQKWNENKDTYLDLGISNMIRSEAMIQDQLDEADEVGEKIPLNTLNRLSQDRADRFGYPKTSQVEHKHDFAALLERAIERSGKAKEVQIIDAKAIEVTASEPPPRKVTSTEGRPKHSVAPASPRPSFAAVLSTKRRRVA
jgi:hypothetical protein